MESFCGTEHYHNIKLFVSRTHKQSCEYQKSEKYHGKCVMRKRSEGRTPSVTRAASLASAERLGRANKFHLRHDHYVRVLNHHGHVLDSEELLLTSFRFLPGHSDRLNVRIADWSCQDNVYTDIMSGKMSVYALFYLVRLGRAGTGLFH
jgi:hypothetical protein